MNKQLDYDKGADIVPIFAEIIDKLNLTGAIAELAEDVTDENGNKKDLSQKDFMKIGIDYFIKKVFKNFNTVKEELREIARIVLDIEEEEFAKNPPGFWKTMKVITEIFKDKDFIDFFSDAIK